MFLRHPVRSDSGPTEEVEGVELSNDIELVWLEKYLLLVLKICSDDDRRRGNLVVLEDDGEDIFMRKHDTKGTRVIPWNHIKNIIA